MVNKCHKQEQQYMLLVLRLHKSVHLQYIANRKVHECVPAQASFPMKCNAESMVSLRQHCLS